MPFQTWLNQSFKDLKSKGAGYWLFVAFLLPIGMLAGDLLSDHRLWVTARYNIYQLLRKVSTHSLKSSTRTNVVLIGDEEYWKGELARRTPLKRSYLAKVLLKLNDANPAVIALDVDLGSQTSDKSVVLHPDYIAETEELRAAIEKVSKSRPVVLPRRLFSENHGEATLLTHQEETYEPDPTVFDDVKFPPNVLTGYISLPYDVRQVPLSLRMKDGSHLDSFAAAVVRPLDKTALEDAQANDKNALPYGTFIAPEKFDRMSATQVLNTDVETLKGSLAARAVLVGGNWHVNSYGRGRQVDTHLTPAGEIGGVFVHGNYVEALLTHRAYKPLGKAFAISIEVGLAIFIALIFAWKMQPWKKLVWASALSLLLIIITYVSWQNLGLFFDFFIPVILLGGHTFLEQVNEWRDEAIEARKARELKGGRNGARNQKAPKPTTGQLRTGAQN